MNKLRQKISNRQLVLLGILFAGTFLYGLLLLAIHRRAGSDDIVFQQQIAPFHSVWDWVSYRYETWSGRIFAESFVYIFSPMRSLFLWKLVSLVMFAGLAGITYLYYTLFAAKRSARKDYCMMAIALFIPLLLGSSAVYDGQLWVTGAMNYFWIGTIAAIGFYPIAYMAAKKRRPKWWVVILCAVLLAIGAVSQEQVGAITAGLAVSFIAWAIWKWRSVPAKKRGDFPWVILLLTVVTLGAFLVGFLAPGNDVRAEKELLTWLPDMYTVSIFDRAKNSIRWLIDAIVNNTGLLIFASAAAMLGLFAAKKSRDNWDKIAMVVLLGTCLLVVSKGFAMGAFWYTFYPVWQPSSVPRETYFAIFFWMIAIAGTTFAPLVLFRKKVIGALVSLLVLAFVGATAIMVLSPTMYASGTRTLYVPSIALMMAVYILVDRFIDSYSKTRAWVAGVIVGAGLLQYIYLLHTLGKQS